MRLIRLSTLALLGCVVWAIGAHAVLAQDIDHWETVVYDDDVWRYLVPTSEPDASWRTTSFDDSAWQEGQGGFGYGDDDDQTVIQEGVVSVFQRITFSISDTSAIGLAVLHVDFDDAFVAYLNDVEIGRSNIGTPGDHPPFDQLASGLHEADLYQGRAPGGFTLSRETLLLALNEGENVLAVQTHNENTSSSDLTSRVFFSVGLLDDSSDYRTTPSWFVPPASAPGTLISNLPLVVIDTQGWPIPDEPKLFAKMGIIDNGSGAQNRLSDAFNAYDGFIGIERRGSSSQGFPKLSYAVETRDADGQDLDVALLGFPEEEDWVLHGPYSDKSLMRNVLIYHLANKMGRYASRTRFVEFILNNEYQGVYVLMEKIKRDKERVAISKLNPDEIEGDDLTGGYIVKVDKWEGSEVDGWFSPHPPRPGLDQRVYYQYHYPKPSDIVEEQRVYIQGVISTFEEVMASDQFADPENGYAKYIDVASAVDFCILNEIARNVDGYRLSTFLHKDKDSIGGGKLIFGPIWDFNLGFGNADYYNGGRRLGFQLETDIPDTDGFQPSFWWEKMWKDPTFNARVIERWQALRQGPIHTDSLMQYIDDQVQLLEVAAPRNFEQWRVLGTYVWPNSFVGNTYADEIDFLKEWLRDRLNWIDTNLEGVTANNEPQLPVSAINLSNVYPNPFAGQARMMLELGLSQNVRVEMYDALGRRVDVVFEGHVEANVPMELAISGQTLASGVYLLRVTGETFSRTNTALVVR